MVLWGSRRASCLAHTALATAMLTASLAACGSSPPPLCSSTNSGSDAPALLADAKQVLDACPAVHFHVESDGSATKAPAGAFVASGDGDAKRPDQFAGSIQAAVGGVLIPVKILAVNGSFYVQPPFTPVWDKTSPEKYGFSDPSMLLSPDTGLTSLLVDTHNPQAQNRDRLNGEELNEISAGVSGTKIDRLLTTADPTADDMVTFGISVETHQLRRIAVTGPFFVKGLQSTYTVTLTNFGETVTVTPPP